MKKSFSWERGPFQQCPSCQQQTFGLLSAGGNEITLRCTACRYSENEALPIVEKTTIYLDQFIFSAIFKIKAGGPAPKGQQDFYEELIPLLRRVVLLQQAVFPNSDLHSKETIVFNDSKGLREAYKDIGGDVSLLDSGDVEMAQVFAFARAFKDGGEPVINFTPDEIILGSRNDWLPDMRIGVNADYSQFAQGIRQERDKGFEVLKEVFEVWRKEKPQFRGLLQRESQFGRHRRVALAEIMRHLINEEANGNALALFNALHHPVWIEFNLLLRYLGGGSPYHEANRRVFDFWAWPRLNDLPTNRISAYLFAALGRRVTMGQLRFTRGIMTDFKAIATYAPYVDAMFVDRECALFLSEGELRNNLEYRAQIFSYSNKAAFIRYLRDIEAQATSEVRRFANQIYGVK